MSPPSLTFLTCPKSCENSGAAQRQAVAMGSWRLLAPSSELIALGGEAGVADLAAAVGGVHQSEVERNAAGTPLVSEVFAAGERLAAGGVLAYVNADIVLGDDFAEAVSKVRHLKRFLMVGRRWDLDVDSPIRVGEPGWWESLRADVRVRGHLHAETGIDYFVFTKGLFGHIPPFALGRCAWDNWLIYKAWSCGAPIIDCTDAVTAIHQNHGYGNDGSQAVETIWNGEEALENRRLAGGMVFDILDSTHVYSAGRIRRAMSREYVLRRMDRLREFHPRMWSLLLSWKARYFFCLLQPFLSARPAA